MALGRTARRPRPGRLVPLAVVGALVVALVWPLRRCSGVGRDQASWAFAPASRGPAATRLRALGGDKSAADEEGSVWKSAYELELERNTLLRDQLQSAGISGEGGEAEPEACTVDWEASYKSLKDCNEALETRLRGGQGPPRGSGGGQAKLSEEELDARLPVKLDVQLEHRRTWIEVFRRHGAGSTFHNVEATLPLGLNITLRERGDLRGSYVVEDVLPGGFGDSSGLIKAGDVLLGLTTRVSSVGVTTFDSGVTSSRQHLVDASFLPSTKELVEAIGTNTDGNLILVLERAAEPQPDE